MNNRMRTWLLVILVMPLSTGFARIGETFGECQTRYGVMIGTDVTNPVYPACVFRKDGIEIRVRFYNATSAQEIFFGIESELTRPQTQEIEAGNLPAGGKAHSETLYSGRDDKRLRGLGVKISQVDRETRQRYGITIEQATSPDTTILGRALDHFDIQLTPHPLGVHGDDGQGQVLVITTAEFEHVLSGTTGF